jgi:hypothetical protein
VIRPGDEKRIRSIGGQRVLISRHANNRILDMAIDPEDIVGAIATPERVVDSSAHPGCVNRRFGAVTLGCTTDSGVLVVLTAVWSSDELWQKDFDRAPYLDRVRRDRFGLAAG